MGLTRIPALYTFQREQKGFIELKDKITEGEFFSALPVKKMVNKEGSKKSRVVYSFEDEISIPLKFIAFKLHKYDNRLSDNCYSFRQGYGVKNAINKIKRNNKIKSMFCYKIDISNYFNSIDPDTLLDRISFLKEEDAVGTVEIILILVVLIALVTLFKKQITSLVEYLLGNVIKNAKAV